MIRIDEGRIMEIIREKRPVSVAINGPEGLLQQVQETAQNITRRFNIPAYIIADTNWGSCDLNTNAAKTLSADIQFNIGHTINVEEYEKNVFLINAFDDIPFDMVARKCGRLLQNKTVSLLTDSQHLHQLESVKAILAGYGIMAVLGGGKGQLREGQVFGCEFYPAMQDSDANVFLGQSNFHAAGVALATARPTYVLDPYFNEVREVSEFAKTLQKKATLAVHKAAEAQTFGVIIGLKEGQMSKTAGLRFKQELERAGKTVHLLAMTNITNERLQNFRVDAFVQTACPRISTDNKFDRPVLSVPQANALIELLNGRPVQSYLQIPHWL